MPANASKVENFGYHAERARKVKAEADIAEIEAAKLRGDMIEAAEVKRAWRIVIDEIRANMLGATPSRIARMIVGVSDETELKRIVREDIELAMVAASRTDIDEVLPKAAEG